MKQTLLVFVWLSIAVGTSTDADACSAFSALSDMGRFTAKNFDWYVGEGLVSINPRGALRRGVLSIPGVEAPWEARFGSVSFSPIGPGFPVSGMNEKGLAVEGLHHTDFDGKSGASDALISLEWAQAVLDRFETVDEVRAFATDTGFAQFALPLHFLVCDKTGACLVAENHNGGTQIFHGDTLDVNALANRSWRKDRNARLPSKSGSILSSVRNFFGGEARPRSSARRFRTLADRIAAGPFRNMNMVFNALDASRILSLTKWQIVWRQDAGAVTWRSFSGNRPGRAMHVAFSDLSFQCNSARSYVGEVTASRNFRFSKCGDVCRESIHARTTRILKMLGADCRVSFMAKLLASSTELSCQNSLSNAP